MHDRVMKASEFKARCLALLDHVAVTREPIVITKHGRAIARVVPLDEDERRTITGSVRLVAAEDAAYYSAGEDWEATDR